MPGCGCWCRLERLCVQGKCLEDCVQIAEGVAQCCGMVNLSLQLSGREACLACTCTRICTSTGGGWEVDLNT